MYKYKVISTLFLSSKSYFQSQGHDISCFSFFNNGSIYFLINVYSDSSQTALKYLKNIEANINNILIMVGDFNIRDNSCYKTSMWTDFSRVRVKI